MLRRLMPCRIGVAAFVAAVSLTWACSRKGEQVDRTKSHPTYPEEAARGQARTNLDSPNPTPAQLERKRRNIEIVKGMGLQHIDHLPVVEDEASVNLRSKDEVVSRCVATAFCAVKGESGDKKLVDGLISRWGVADKFSQAEGKFIRDPAPSRQDATDFAWRYECVHVLLWALGYLPALNPPDKIADVAKEAGLMRNEGPEGFSVHAKLRPLSEILDMADLYYRLDWAAVNLRLKGRTHEKANEEIIVERHRALNWLIRYMNQEWDDVTTDT